MGRQTSETGALGTVRYAYDAAGRRTQLTYPDGFYVTYGYDAASELTTIKDNTGFTLATYAWDNYGRRSSLTLGNAATTSYTYDNYSNLALLNVNLPSGQNQAISLGYNPAGQIKSRSASNDAYAYTGASASSNAYTLNGRNQIAVSGPSTFSYDGRGNLTNDGVNTYAYDIANRLTTVGSVSLSYDPLSRLAKTAGSATTQFAYDGSEIIAEYNSAGAEQSRYVRGPGSDQPIVWYNVAGGTRYWLQANPQGSIIAVTGDNGAAAAINTYDDYGLPGGGNFGRFQYTGQAWIPEIRMFDYKSRIYSPNLGRFLQSDPIGYGDGMNFYNYTHGDPVNRRDPTGTRTCPTGTYDDGSGVCRTSTDPDDTVVTGHIICPYGTYPQNGHCVPDNDGIVDFLGQRINSLSFPSFNTQNMAQKVFKAFSTSCDASKANSLAAQVANFSDSVSTGAAVVSVGAAGVTALGIETGPADAVPAVVAEVSGYTSLAASGVGALANGFAGRWGNALVDAGNAFAGGYAGVLTKGMSAGGKFLGNATTMANSQVDSWICPG